MIENNRKKTLAFNNQQRAKPNSGGKGRGKRASLKKAKKDFDFDAQGFQIWYTMSICTKATDIQEVLEGLNINLKHIGVFTNLKGVQCWKSYPKFILTCVNSNLCPAGVAAIMEKSLFREQRKLC